MVRNSEEFHNALHTRGIDAAFISRVEGLAKHKLALQRQLEAMQALVNSEGQNSTNDATAREHAKRVRKRLQSEHKLAAEALSSEMLDLPNLPHFSSPLGATEAEDIIVRERRSSLKANGIAPDASKPEEELNPICAAKVAGPGFELLRGKDARMLRGLVQFAMDLHSAHFEELSLPSLVSDDAMVGSGHLPKFARGAYAIADQRLWLAPTAEVAFCAIHRGRRFEARHLPARYIASATCFRREVGGGGVASQFRLHQYQQVELFSICDQSTSLDELHFMLERAELALCRLGMRYRVVELCRGRLPFSAAKAYKLEVFLPQTNRWIDVSTVSLATDFQARRGDIRLSPKGGRAYVHTVNASALACSRIRLAIAEYGYSGDFGSSPSALGPYLRAENHCSVSC